MYQLVSVISQLYIGITGWYVPACFCNLSVINIGTHIACMSYFEMKCFDSACGELLQLLSLVSLVIFMLRSFWKSNSMERHDCLMIIIFILCGAFIVICGGSLIICGAYVIICGGFRCICGGFFIICGARFIICGSIFIMRGAFLFICGVYFTICGDFVIMCGAYCTICCA